MSRFFASFCVLIASPPPRYNARPFRHCTRASLSLQLWARTRTAQNISSFGRTEGIGWLGRVCAGLTFARAGPASGSGFSASARSIFTCRISNNNLVLGSHQPVSRLRLKKKARLGEKRKRICQRHTAARLFKSSNKPDERRCTVYYWGCVYRALTRLPLNQMYSYFF